MDDILRLVNEFGASQCGGTVIIAGDNGVNEEAAVNNQGTWVINQTYRELLSATPKPDAVKPKAKKDAAPAPVDAPVDDLSDVVV